MRICVHEMCIFKCNERLVSIYKSEKQTRYKIALECSDENHPAERFGIRNSIPIHKQINKAYILESSLAEGIRG